MKEIKRETAALQSSIKACVLRTKECDDKADRLIKNRKQTARQKVRASGSVFVGVRVDGSMGVNRSVGGSRRV